MDSQRKFAHIVAYYLSRFDKEALRNLGFKTDKEAFNSTAASIGVKPNYIKFRRDEFDVIHPFRQGWHKRPITPSISKTAIALQDLDEPALREIIQEILDKGNTPEIEEEMGDLIQVLPSESDRKKKKERVYIPRGITGQRAEEEFLQQFNSGKLSFPAESKIRDVRNEGCGYDFEITIVGKKICVEVKGLAADDGGVMFTNKEWETAKEKGSNYYLAVVGNLAHSPWIKLVNNPFEVFTPKMRVQSVIQINWNVSQKNLKDVVKINEE